MIVAPPLEELSGTEVKLSIRGLSKKFKGSAGEVVALSNVSLDVRAGEFLILVGQSGCGKSTLLNIIGGLDSADSGSVLMDGRAVTLPGPDRAMVFQEGALFPWLTAVKNVEFGLTQIRVPKHERRDRALHYLNIVGLSKFSDACIHELSGGMRQRVAIARSLAVEPRVLLMDEPFSALDAQTREDLYIELQRIWESTGATILFVTHNVREAVTLGDRVVLLRRPAERGDSSIQSVFDVEIMRPRHIDDMDVARMAKQISLTMRHGHDKPEDLTRNEEQLDAPSLLRGFDSALDGRS
ncbi:MAG: ABC transporter ATP-binding protein [Fimbriimonas sp.]